MVAGVVRGVPLTMSLARPAREWAPAPGGPARGRSDDERVRGEAGAGTEPDDQLAVRLIGATRNSVLTSDRKGS